MEGSIIMDIFKKYCKYNIGSTCQLGYKECPMLCNYFEDYRDYNIVCEYMVTNGDNCECLKYNRKFIGRSHCDNCTYQLK